ncbi:MAG: FAD:protein FMN transferase [Burkholderiales bacterium]
MQEGDLAFEFQAMGTACRIHVAGAAEALATRAAQAAIAEVRRIEAKYSRYLPGSIVSRINAAAGSERVIEVDDETAHLLDFAAQVHDASDGLFDITTGVLRRVWDFRAAVPPSAAQVDEVLQQVGWRHVQWQRPGVLLTRPGMELDFGGFGKEYATDRASTVLADAGIGAALVNLGGDMRALGPRPDGRAWSLGIAHPRVRGAVIASIEIHAGGLATSGDYERYFEHGGVRYCHILDPRSGWPVPGLQSVSVVAPACVAAGALSTIAMLRGASALEFLRGQRAEFLVIDGQGRVFREPI